jgi:esterase/lipase superfamily enzyme
MRKFSLTLAAAALVLAWAGLGSAVAQNAPGDRIEKAANQRLSGSSYISLRGLSYEDCEKRCLAEQQCKALVHVREGAAGAIASQCRLFSTFGTALAAQDSDVGYKRQGLAKDTSPPPPPSAQPRGGSAAPPPKPETATRPAPPPVISAPPPPPVTSAPPPASAPTPRGVTAPPPPGGTARSMEAERGPSTRSAAPAPPPPAGNPAVGAGAPPSSDWDVVPVFFGTDRGRRDQPKRVAYGTERGHNLELGRAMITVPKAHQVPNVERPWAIKIPYTSVVLYQQDEDPKKHFTIQEIKALSKEQLLVLIKERLRGSKTFQDQALVFVHGYNNGFDEALFRTAQIAYDLKYDGAPFLYSWPSGAGIAGYPYDRESSQQAEPFFKAFMQMVLKETGAKNVSIIAHSMGNQLLLQTLRNLDRANPEIARINQIILAAPDVDRDSFAFLATQIRGVGRGITMYASSNDVALSFSRRFAGGVPRAGDVPAGLGPLIVAGVDTIDVSALSTEYFSLNHSSYAEKTGLLRDIELVLQTGERPPEMRLPLLQRIKGVAGDYWRYPK